MGEGKWVISRCDCILPFVLAKEFAGFQDGTEDEVRP